jgi:hypothetical protein
MKSNKNIHPSHYRKGMRAYTDEEMLGNQSIQIPPLKESLG